MGVDPPPLAVVVGPTAVVPACVVVGAAVPGWHLKQKVRSATIYTNVKSLL